MKVLFLIGAVLVLVGSTSATLSDSFTIGSQYAKLVADVTLATHNLKAYTIQLLGNSSAPYMTSFITMEDYFKNLLMQLGQTGIEICNRVEMNLSEEFKKLIMVYNPLSLDASMSAFLNSYQGMYLTQVNVEMPIHIIKAIRNPKVITCWSTYIAPLLKVQFATYASKSRKIIEEELSKATVVGKSLVDSIINAVKAFETQARNACGSDSSCYVNFFVSNEQNIQNQTDSYYNGIMTIIKNAMGTIGSRMTSTIQNGIDNLRQANTNFATCYA